MKLFIPACGDRIVLEKDWAFTLHSERRNRKFAESQGIPVKGYSFNTQECTLPAGTVLECDRIYIRAFSKSTENDYDSITWKVVAKKNSRFWAKLADCNTICYVLPELASYKERSKAEKEIVKNNPVKLTADDIRNGIYHALYGRGDKDFVALVKLVKEKALTFFAESKSNYDKKVDAYISDCIRTNRFYMNGAYSLSEDKFLDVLFGNSLTCKYSFNKKKNVCCRKFYLPEYDSGIHSLNYLEAIKGLSYTVITDENDQYIIDIKFCEEREKS